MVLLACISVYSAEMPKGFGGVLFGQTLSDIKNQYDSTLLYIGDEEYRFEPTEKFLQFEDYYFVLTPVSKKVFKIVMRVRFKDAKVAREYRDTVINTLATHYGSFTYVGRGSVYLQKDKICVYCFYLSLLTGEAIVDLTLEDESMSFKREVFQGGKLNGFETGEK